MVPDGLVGGAFEVAMQLTSGPHIRTSINIEYARIDADRWIDGSDRSIELLLAMQDEAAIEVGGGKARIELDGLFIPDVAADIVGLRVIGIEADRLVEVADGSQEIAAAVGGDSPLPIEIGIVR